METEASSAVAQKNMRFCPRSVPGCRSLAGGPLWYREGGNCYGRDPRQLGGVAGGRMRRAVETLDRTTNTDRRGERFNYVFYRISVQYF